MSSPHFSPATLTFLRALKRNNDREWFRARKDRYEREVREPMLAVIAQLAQDFQRFAPEIVASPKASMYRIYRDTRFSADKTPLKTHVAASFPWRGLHRHQGAGLYFEVAPGGVWIGGGMYSPEPPQLVKVREHIADTWPEIQTLTRAKAFKTLIGELGGQTLTRVPRGYPVDHPAAAVLRHKQFLAGRELPADLAARDDFYPTLIATFKAIVPLVRFLNEPLTEDGGARRWALGARRWGPTPDLKVGRGEHRYKETGGAVKPRLPLTIREPPTAERRTPSAGKR